MASNYLEQLVAEWYEYQGFYVKRNVLVGRRPKGGYECELDVVAFHPEERALVHVEPSMDADSWAIRERRYTKKFRAGRKYIPALFPGLDTPQEIDQYALFVFASDKNHETVGSGRVVTIRSFLRDVFEEIGNRQIANAAVPEHLPTLRSFQFVSQYRDDIQDVWRSLGVGRKHAS